MRIHTPAGIVVVRRETRIPSNGDAGYAREKFAVAADALATHRGGIRERLTKAAREFMLVSPLDFPEDLQGRYVALRRDMTRLMPKHSRQDRFDATISRVRLATCEDFARRICELADELRDRRFRKPEPLTDARKQDH
jgi:hypothetical protein